MVCPNTNGSEILKIFFFWEIVLIFVFKFQRNSKIVLKFLKIVEIKKFGNKFRLTLNNFSDDKHMYSQNEQWQGAFTMKMRCYHFSK